MDHSESPLKSLSRDLQAQTVLLDLLDEGALIVDLDGFVRFANRAAEAMFGVESGGLGDRKFEELAVGDSAGESTRFISGFEERRIEEEEILLGFQKPDGREFRAFCRCRTVVDEFGEIGGFAVGLREKRDPESGFIGTDDLERLRELADSLPIMVWSARPDGTIDYANQRCIEFTGVLRGESLEDQLIDIIHPEDVGEHMRRRRESIETGKPYASECRFRNIRDGSFRWFQVKALPIRDSKEIIRRWYGTAIDIHETKELEAEASSLAKRLTSTLENITDGFFFLDPEWRVVHLNSEAEKLLMQKKEDLLGKVFWEEFPDLVELSFYREYVRATRTGIGVSFEDYHPGRKKWYSVTAHPLEEGLAVYFRDVTEQRRAEDEIRASEERFRLFVKSTQDVIWDWEPARERFLWMENFGGFGYKSEDFLFRIESWAERVHPEDRREVVQSFKEALKKRSTEWFDEYRFLRRDGSFAYVLDRAHIMRDRDGNVMRVIGGLTDLTVQRAHEEQLRAQAALLDKARDAILVCGLDGRILYWNKSAERLYGWRAEEAIGGLVDYLLYRSEDEFARKLDERLKSENWISEVDHFTEEGESILVEERWTLVRDDDGNPSSVLMMNADITARKKLEVEALRNQRLGSIGTLASGIAHDLNNIFAPIRMGIDLLKSEEKEGRFNRVLTMMQMSASRGADLVSQILTFARGVEGEQKVIHLSKVLEDVSAVVRDTFPKTIRFELEMSEKVWSVKADPTQIHQVLMNLCVNARDAMAGGGMLRIVLRNCRNSELSRLIKDGKPALRCVKIEVEDSGSGISPEIREQIFDPFFTTKEAGKGTGLGLSTVMMIVKGHGGSIGLSSEEGGGTRFQIYLPAVEQEEKRAVREPVTSFPRGSGEWILVVDDEDAIRHVTGKTLERFGYQVLTAKNGADALEIFRKNRKRIALVLTDMAMPVMDGAATIEALKKEKPDLRIIASSGFVSHEKVLNMAVGEIEEFMAKPYTVEHLLEVVRSVLEKS